MKILKTSDYRAGKWKQSFWEQNFHCCGAKSWDFMRVFLEKLMIAA